MGVDAKTIKAVFLAALEKSTPTDRAAYLDEACAGDAALRQCVEALLQTHDSPDDLLDQPAVQHIATEVDATALAFLEPSAKPGSLGRLAHYDVLEAVGQGGMGVVLRAFDGKLRRVVAIKALIPTFAGNGEARQRFVREARAAAAVTHDNVISIHAVEEAGPIPYLVMQFIDGCTLQQKLDRIGPLPLKEVLRIGLQIAEGLAAAHRQGLIHRDIKPANILLENGIERVKITDFGLARAVDDASLTRSGYIAGTPTYMSPEQANGDRVDHRSDLFSLGSVLYATCSGAPPFQADTAMAVLKQVCDHTPRPLRELNIDTPDWLQELVAKLHAKSPSDRYASVAEVAAILSRRLSELQSGGKFSDADAANTVVKFSGKAHAKRRAALWILLALVLLGGGSWLAYQSWRGNPSEPDQAGSDPPTKNGGSSKEPAPAPASPVVLTPFKTLKQHTRGVRALASTRDGNWMASGGLDRNIYLWDTKTWLARGPFKGHPGDVSALSFSPTGKHLASVTSGADTSLVRVWDVDDGTQIALGTGSGGMWDVAYSPDGKTLACGGWDRTLHLLDVETATKRHTITDVASQYLRTLSFTPDSLRIATGGTGESLLFDVETGKKIPLRVHLREGMCPTILARGTVLAGWNHGDGLVTLCDLPSGQIITDWRAHPKFIEGIAASADGRFIATFGTEGVVKVWSIETRKEVATLNGHEGPVFAAVFTPGGDRLITGGGKDACIHIWDLPPVCRTVK